MGWSKLSAGKKLLRQFVLLQFLHKLAKVLSLQHTLNHNYCRAVKTPQLDVTS